MINEIKKHENDNLGSVVELKFLPIEAVETMPIAVNGAVHAPVVLKQNFAWINCYCSPNTISFKEDAADSEHGTYYKKKLSGKTPKDRSEVIDSFSKMDNGKFILLYKDANGTLKLIGSPDEPIYFKNSFSTKEDVAQRNEYDINFEGDGLLKSPVYNL
jgi:hypothetical protein